MSKEIICDVSYTQVPPEIWKNILDTVSDGDKIAVSRSCRFFYNITNDEEMLPKEVNLCAFAKSWEQLKWAAQSAKTTPTHPMEALGCCGTPEVLEDAILEGFSVSKRFLCSVIEGDNVEMFEYLGQKGYYSNPKKDIFRYAIEHGYYSNPMKDIFRYAIEHISLDVLKYMKCVLNYNDFICEHMYLATGCGNVEILEVLWGDYFRDPDWLGWSCVNHICEIAAEAGHIGVLNYFWTVFPESHKHLIYSSNILREALKAGQYETAEYLLENGSAYPWDICEIAIRKQDLRLLDYLREKGHGSFGEFCEITERANWKVSRMWLVEHNYLRENPERIRTPDSPCCSPRQLTPERIRTPDSPHESDRMIRRSINRRGEGNSLKYGPY